MIQISQINIIAVGIENYQFMKRLHGPHKDIDVFENILVKSDSTGLYLPSQITTLIDVDSQNLRNCINDYVINRSAPGDVLIFYFSGHGIPIGRSDFGFCTSDARIHDVFGTILPLTVLRFTDLIDSLRIMSITPIIVIDACFSGIVGNTLNLTTDDIINNMQQKVSSNNASNYALLCSCTDRQLSYGNMNGGIFSQIIFDILTNGLKSQKHEKNIYLQNIFPELKKRAQSEVFDSTPQLFIGETIPPIPLVKNICFIQQRYRFQPYMASIILTLWNGGDERELSKAEILSTIGRGAYGNHRKLSFSGWDLIEDNPINGKRRLTARGRQFAQGKLFIPYDVIYDSEVNNYIAVEDSKLIDINFSIRQL